MKTLIIVAHPYLDNSVINKRWIEELKKYPEKYTIHHLDSHYTNGKLDIENEKKLIEAHGNLILQFPIFWFNCPPIMKQWLDEVLIPGWAYAAGEDKEGEFIDRKVALAVTTGMAEKNYHQEGRFGHTLKELLAPFETTLKSIHADYRSFYAFYGAESKHSQVEIDQSAKDYLEFIDHI